MKITSFLFLCFFLTYNTRAQELLLQQTDKFDSRKTVQLYAIVQPLSQQQTFLNEQLQNAQLPATNPFNLGLGFGLEYSFQTGTSLRLETVFNHYRKKQNESLLSVQPVNYELSIKQLFLSYSKLRPFVTAGFGGWEQTLQISRTVAQPGTIQDLLNTPNTVHFTSATDYFSAGIGINLLPFDNPTKRVTDFTELELGVRSGIGNGFLYNRQTELPPLVKDRFLQYYLSLKAGISYKRKKL